MPIDYGPGTEADPNPIYLTPTDLANTIVCKQLATAKTVNNTATLGNITGFSQAIEVGETWMFWVNLVITSASTTSDWKLGLTYPSGATGYWSTGAIGAGQVATGSSPTAATDIGTALTGGSINGTYPVSASAVILNGTTAGTVQVQIAQNTATSEDTTVLANFSIFRAQKAA